MKKMMIAAGSMLFALAVHAQQPAPPRQPGMEERLKRTNEIMEKEVQPTAAQQASIESVFKTFFVAADKVRKDNPPPPPDPKVKAAMDKLAAERDESIKKILTEAQFKKYVEAEKKMRPPKPGEQKGPNDAPPPPNK
jgi:Spy/CpxP family protein refolding chaperone